MGRTSKGKTSITHQVEMFGVSEMGKDKGMASFTLEGARIPEAGISRPPDQTNSKSRLIAEYISMFQLVTRGGLYIDGFAAPQSRPHEEAWTARRVLELGVCQRSCPPISCGISDFWDAGFAFGVEPNGPSRLPVAGFA